MSTEENAPSVLIPGHDLVRVTKMNHIVEVQHMEKRSNGSSIRRIDKDRYVDIRTGEIRDFQSSSEKRSDNYNSLRKTFKNLGYLINSNFKGGGNELHITLTYKENMTDTKRLYEDFKKFIMRFRYSFKSYGSIDYLTVIEPQERGAWHHHLLVRFNDVQDKIYLDNKAVSEIWGHGFIKIRTMEGNDNIGVYLSAYLSDAELTDSVEIHSAGQEIVTKVVDGVEKKFVKGGRLHRYPNGMNLYRTSRGIKKPDRVDMPYSDIKKVVGSAKPHYTKSIKIETEDFNNVITYEQYNMKR